MMPPLKTEPFDLQFRSNLQKECNVHCIRRDEMYYQHDGHEMHPEGYITVTLVLIEGLL